MLYFTACPPNTQGAIKIFWLQTHLSKLIIRIDNKGDLEILMGCAHLKSIINNIFIDDNKKRVGGVNIYSYNVRGIKDVNKRERLLNHLKSNYPGVYCLQETHLSVQDEAYFQNVFGDNCYFSHYSAQSRRVCIIIPKWCDFQLTKKEVDVNGRYVLVNGKINNKEITILNVYAPTQDKQIAQSDFYDSIFELVDGK